jgi:isoleucyl-tRNA synthetase
MDEEAKVILSAKPNPQLLGPRFGKAFGTISKQIANLTREQMLTVEGGEAISLNGETFQPNEVQILRQAREGAPDVRSDRFISIELPCKLTDELIAEGCAREVVHHIQQMRKDAGYQVEDRIAVTYDADPRLAAAIERHLAYIQQETLARSLRPDHPQGDRVATIDIDGVKLTVGVRREEI